MSDFGQCSNWLQLNLISLLINCSYELKQIMTRYVFLGARWVIWAMFEPTPTWYNLDFGQIFMWIGANNVPDMTS